MHAQGQTQNTSVTLGHLAASQPQAVFLIGDLTYADDSLTNCEAPEVLICHSLLMWMKPTCSKPLANQYAPSLCPDARMLRACGAQAP
jgi:hypothetical protein